MSWVALGFQLRERPGFLPKESGAGVAAENGAVVLGLELREFTVLFKD